MNRIKRPAIADQIVVLTGASSGIGRAAALRLAGQGATVVLAARDQQKLRELADEIIAAGGRAHAIPTDVSRREDVERLAAETVARFGRIDTWINDAGVSVYGTTLDTPIEDMEQVLRVNLLGAIYGMKAALPHLVARGTGTIINISSVAGVRALPLQGAYSASKHGLRAFADALRMELMRSSPYVYVTTILPSGINTPFFAHARSYMGVKPMPIPPAYTPSLAADTIVHAVVADPPPRHVYVGGAGWGLALLERLSPALTDRLMVTGGALFRLQQSNQPPNEDDNLYTPVAGEAGKRRGEWWYLTKPSLYTPLFELRPAVGWLAAALAAVWLAARARR